MQQAENSTNFLSKRLYSTSEAKIQNGNHQLHRAAALGEMP
jgi:hypothetical protein